MLTTIYLIERIEDEEYGSYSPVRAFRTREQADAFIIALGSPTWQPWYAESPLPCYVITPVEME